MRNQWARVLAVVVVGCSGAEGPPPDATPSPPAAPAAPSAVSSPAPAATTAAQPAPTPAPEPEGTLLQQLMKSHFVQVVKIRSAVIDGSVDRAIGPARTIVEMQGVDTLPKAWRTSVTELQAASDRIRQSPDLQEAAEATADIGMTCGGCHMETKKPEIKVAAPPASDGSLPARMRRHLWASERLWEGLYGPSDAAWKAGAEALETTPFPKETLAKGGVHVRALASTVVALGKRARQTTDAEARARIYARYLGSCSACHDKVRDP